MWIESTVEISGRSIELQIERLDDHRREEAARRLAWLTLAAFSNGASVAMAAWHDYTAALLREHVALAGNESHPDECDAGWWEAAFGRVLVEFIRLNGLATSIDRQIEEMREVERRRGADA